MSRLKIVSVCCVTLLIAKCEFGATAAVGPMTQRLTVREEPGRVVLAWNGPIAEPMRDTIVAALDRLKSDKRRLVITFNSPGGSLAHGREVMAAIGEAARVHQIDTLVEKGSVCASMCVPIYLIGTQRTADPSAHFMFHEASLNIAADKDVSESERVALTPFRKAIEASATDDLFENDIGSQRINAEWLSDMRTRIAGRDVWLTGQQLVDEGSGVVDVLVQTTAN